jgi:hypothetical protein
MAVVADGQIVSAGAIVVKATKIGIHRRLMFLRDVSWGEKQYVGRR